MATAASPRCFGPLFIFSRKLWTCRMLAPFEALTGVLMCGLSTALFFAFIAWWISNGMPRETALKSHSAVPMDSSNNS
jgi:hypothetical protein